jgi:hypothetical protein
MHTLQEIRASIQSGGPSSASEARDIISEISQNHRVVPFGYARHLSNALMTILINRELHQETYTPRARAISLIDELGGALEEEGRDTPSSALTPDDGRVP